MGWIKEQNNQNYLVGKNRFFCQKTVKITTSAFIFFNFQYFYNIAIINRSLKLKKNLYTSVLYLGNTVNYALGDNMVYLFANEFTGEHNSVSVHFTRFYSKKIIFPPFIINFAFSFHVIFSRDFFKYRYRFYDDLVLLFILHPIRMKTLHSHRELDIFKNT